MSTLGDLIVKIGADATDFFAATESVINQVDKLGDKVESRFDSIANVGRRLAVFGAELTAAVTLPIEEMGRRALETAAQFEQTQIAFTTFLGSAASAQSMLAQLYQFAATTPFEVPGVLQGGRTLLAMGFAAKDVVPIMRVLGDTASGLGVGQGGLERFVFHLGQIKALGHIDGMILREMGQNGVAAAQMIADYMGKSVPEITKMVTAKDPKLDSTTVINALLAGMNTQFGGAMSDQMATLAGQWSNFKDQITLTMVEVGNTLLPIGKQILAWASEAVSTIKELSQWFVTLPPPVQGAAIALLGMAAAAGPALTAIGGIGIILPGIMAVLTPLAAALGISVAALGGWAVAIVAALAAITALGVWVFEHWAGVKAALATAFEGLKEIWQTTLGAPLMALIALFEWVYARTQPIWDAIGAVLTTTWHSITQAALAFWTFLKNDVFGPMFAMLQQIPGMGKLLSVGDAFEKADAKDQKDKSDQSAISAAESTLHLGSHAPQITDSQSAWADKHKHQVEEYTKAVAVLDQQFAAHKVKAEEVAEAHRVLNALLAQKPPVLAHEKEAKHHVDRNALAGLTGENAHEEAMFGLRRAAVAHEYESAQPGYAAKAAMSPEAIADMEMQAAARRRQELIAIAGDELKSTLKTLDEKLKLYKADENGHQQLIEAKKKAQDKYVQELQKAGFQEQDVAKRLGEQIEADTRRRHEEELREEKRHVDALSQVRSVIAETAKRHQEAMGSLRDKRLQYELETGELSKAQYLRIKQQELDEAYALEVAALEKERALLEQEFDGLLSKAKTPQERQRISDDYRSRSVRMDAKRQQTDDRHASDTKGIDIEKDRQTYSTFFKPIETSFASGMKGLIEGTKTFKQAWADMSKSMLDSWITSLTQMAAKWVAHKAMELLLHIGTNHAKVANDAVTEGQSFAISLASHVKKLVLKGVELTVHIATNIAKLASTIISEAMALAIHIASHMRLAMVAAKEAAMWAFAAVMHIPVIGPILAPAAAVAAYAGVLSWATVSAEHGAVLPNHDTIAFLHPREMVLPSHLATGLQSMINGGTIPSGGQMHGFLGSGAPNAQTAGMLSAAASGGDTHHSWGGVQITMHNSARDPLTPDGIFAMMQQAVRGRNLKMA